MIQPDIQPEKQADFPNLNKGRWQKGQSGNPNGRPKRTDSITALLRESLYHTDESSGKTKAEVVVETLVRLATEGNLKAIGIIFDRLEGRVPNQVQIETEGPAFTIVFEPGQNGG